MYADFDLRMNHADIVKGRDNVKHRAQHIKPNLDLISFQEMRLIKGDLKYWEPGVKKWMPVFPNNAQLHGELMKLYNEYAFEKSFL